MALELNVDLGELPDEADEFYRLATVANVACGGHAGDRQSMERACVACSTFGTRLAAHPSYPDRAHFGRRRLELPEPELRASLGQQLRALREIAEAHGLRVEAMKPHGALYHDVNARPELAELVLAVTVETLGAVALVGSPGGELQRAAEARGLDFVREGFADRGYDERGRLVPRGESGALLQGDAAAEAALRLARAGRFDSLCVHGDMPGSLVTARRVREVLEREGFLPERAR
ncbi:MAG TPA: 5-oxoprolinase subunit PxpA [Polyangiaceae bacterium]|nr:5-oxoprolinase subunit PxpA [Polyangiaceae bacterium]